MKVNGVIVSDLTPTSYIPLVRLAEEVGFAPAAMKRSLARAGMAYEQVRINGREVYAVTKEGADSFKERRTTIGVVVSPQTLTFPGVGGVYLVRPDPELRPNRIKIGWTDDFTNRLKMHRCIAPGLEVLCLWCTSFEWMERMALNLTSNLPGSTCVSREVLDVSDYNDVVSALCGCFQAQGIKQIATPTQ